MSKLLLFLFLVILLSIPIVKADLITCPATVDLGSFFSRLICNTGNWFLGHALGLVILIIIIAVIYFYWYSRNDKTRSKIGLYSKIALLIILLMIFYPSIKALLFTSPFIPPPEPYFSCNDPCISDVTCTLSCSDSPPFFHTNATNRHTSTEEYYALSNFPGDPANKTVYAYPDGGVDYDMLVLWNDTGTCDTPNSTYYACKSDLGTGLTEACTGSIAVGERALITIKYISGSGNYDLSYNCTT